MALIQGRNPDLSTLDWLLSLRKTVGITTSPGLTNLRSNEGHNCILSTCPWGNNTSQLDNYWLKTTSLDSRYRFIMLNKHINQEKDTYPAAITFGACTKRIFAKGNARSQWNVRLLRIIILMSLLCWNKKEVGEVDNRVVHQSRGNLMVVTEHVNYAEGYVTINDPIENIHIQWDIIKYIVVSMP